MPPTPFLLSAITIPPRFFTADFRLHGFGILHSAFCILHFLIRAIGAIRGSIPFVAALRCCVFCDLSRSFAAIKDLVLRFLRIFAAIQSKRLSMNHLHAKPGHSQPRSIKPNQA